MKLRMSSVQFCSQHAVFVLNIVCALHLYPLLISDCFRINNSEHKLSLLSLLSFYSFESSPFSKHITCIPNFFSKFCLKWQNSTYMVATSSKKLIQQSSFFFLFPESRLLNPKCILKKAIERNSFFLFLQPQDSIEAASAGENWPQWIRRAMIIGHRRRRRRSQERPDHSGTFEPNFFHISNREFGHFQEDTAGYGWGSKKATKIF